jgi:hypothetical protein
MPPRQPTEQELIAHMKELADFSQLLRACGHDMFSAAIATMAYANKHGHELLERRMLERDLKDEQTIHF